MQKTTIIAWITGAVLIIGSALASIYIYQIKQSLTPHWSLIICFITGLAALAIGGTTNELAKHHKK